MTRRSIKFDCHYCLNSVTAWQDECGREFPCPHCQTVIIVPSQPIDASLFDDIFESLNPSELATPPSSSPVAPTPEISRNEVENSVVVPTVSKIAAETIAPKTEVSKAAPQARPPAAASPNNVMEQLLDEAAESQAAGSGEQVATSAGDLIELDEKILEPDIADVPLKIDGWDFEQPTEVISLKCKICDSRIHTETSKIDTEITCPVCYTKILVTGALIDKLVPAKQGNPRETKMSYQSAGKRTPAQDDDAEIPLIPLEMQAKSEDPIPVLASKVSASGSSSKSEVGQTSSKQVSSSSTSLPHAGSQDAQLKPIGKTLSRREKYEAAQRRLAGLDGPRRAHKSSSRAQDRQDESDSEQANPSRSDQVESSVVDAPVVEYSRTRLWTMLSSPGLRWRAGLAAGVIGIGSGMMHRISFQYTELREPTIPDWIMNTLVWAGMGLLPYFIGVGLLWLLCGFVFREAASGKEQVSDWTIGSFSELKSTFLVFGFSFFIAGLPISPIPFMFAFVHPLRCLLAPLLLLGAWYQQNPLAILAVDAFQNFRRESNEWGKFYMVATGMGAIGFIGGLLMMLSLSSFSFLTSLLGAGLVTISTVIFAAVTGWHCGWVVAGTQVSKSKQSVN